MKGIVKSIVCKIQGDDGSPRNLGFFMSFDPSYWLFPTLKVFFIVKAPCLEKFKYSCLQQLSQNNKLCNSCH